MSDRQTVSVIIPVKNVASFVRPTLESVRFADEVVVVDMFSDDDTRVVCESYPNVVFVQNDDFIFANVNFGIDRAVSDWVIRLDSDEVIGETLRENILKFLEAPDASVNTLRFRGLNHMFGFPMHHGIGSPHASWRKHMFRRGTARYACKSEHEDITSQGGTRDLDGVYEHYTNHTTEEIIRKFNYYTSKDVDRLTADELTLTSVWRTFYIGLRLFVLYYFQWKGYKDGVLGFYTSLFRGPIYVWIESAKRWEAWAKRDGRAGGNA